MPSDTALTDKENLLNRIDAGKPLPYATDLGVVPFSYKIRLTDCKSGRYFEREIKTRLNFRVMAHILFNRLIPDSFAFKEGWRKVGK